MSENLFFNLKIKAQNIAGELKKVSSGFTNLGRNVKQSTGTFGSWYTKTKKTNMALSNITKDANRSATGFKNMGNSLGGLNQIIGISKIYMLANGISNAVQSTMDMIETTNLFSVSLGNVAVETNKTIDAMHNLYGLDTTNLQSTIGTYALLARSMGMNTEQAKKLSVNTSQLAIDLASLTNIPITQVMQDLRSGLVGQSETVYKYGIDVTEAGIKAEAMRQGIEKSVRNMSQGEKMALRYSAMIRQTSLAQGDFARTIDNPSNQFKILSERVTTASRSIGSMFLTTIAQVLPYLNAFLIIITRIADRIASAFGYEKPIVTNGVGQIGVEAEDSASEVDGLTNSLKKLKDFKMGFDELNVIDTSDSDDADVKGASILGDMDLTGYDNLMNTINQQAEELANKLEKPFINMLKTVGLIGIGIASWKLANGLFSILNSTSLPLLGAISSVWKAFASPSGQTIKLMSVLGNSTAYVAPLAVITALAVTLGIMILRFIELYQKSESFRNGLAVLNTGLVTVGTGIANFVNNALSFLGDLDLKFGDVLLTLGGIGLLFTPLAPFGIALLAFEALTLAVRGIGVAFSPAITQADIFAEGVSEATKTKVQPFLDKMNELGGILTTIELTKPIISNEMATDVQTKVAQIKETILNELSADRNEDLANLEPLKVALGEETFASLKTATDTYYADMATKITTNEAEINKILTTASTDKRTLTSEEVTEINRLRDEMNSTGIAHLSENEIEYNTIMNRLKTNSVALSLEQSVEILKNAKATKDGTIEDAEKQYSEIELSAKRMLSTGQINDEQYKLIMEKATEAKNATTKDAEDQYNTIFSTTKTKLGETSRYIDETTLDIKTKWKVWTEGLGTKIGEAWTDIEEGFSRFGVRLKIEWYTMWGGVRSYFEDVFYGIAKYAEDKVNSIISSVNSAIDMLNKLPAIDIDLIEKVKFVDKQITSNGLELFANGGFPDMGSMFVANESGAELLGNINGKTAVVNNDQIVEAVSTGVAKAVASVMGTVNQQPVELFLDGEKIYSNQQKIQRNRGVNFGMGVFAR